MSSIIKVGRLLRRGIGGCGDSSLGLFGFYEVTLRGYSRFTPSLFSPLQMMLALGEAGPGRLDHTLFPIIPMVEM